MKRDPALAPLSRDHHANLALASRLRRATKGKDPSALTQWQAVLADWGRQELEPHFQLEEQILLPAVRQADGEHLAQRTRQEHDELRIALAALDSENSESFLYFSHLLTAHVRFEERELFPWLQQHLGTTALADLARFIEIAP